jgi:uncharacterized protein YbaP (TraB family)
VKPRRLIARLGRLWLLAAWLLAAQAALALPAMWQSRDGRLTVFGTIHALPPQTPQGPGWYTPAARAAFAASDRLVVEVDIPQDQAALGAVVARLGLLPAPVPLASRLPPAARNRLPAALAAVGVPDGALDRLESWLAAITLVQAQVIKAGLDPAAGVDRVLLAEARAASKPLVGLETVEGQFGLFDGLPEAEQRRLLADAVTGQDDMAAQVQALAAAWMAGDVVRIRRDFDASRLSPELERRLFTQRNRAWAKWAQTALAAPGARPFMAVGAAHLPGRGGLIARLEASGIAMRRVQ